MYYAVVHIKFDSGTTQGIDRKSLQSMIEKLRAKFTAVIRPVRTMEQDGSISLAIATLAESEIKLSRQLDAMAAACEEIGLGRIESEESILDHLDNLSDDEIRDV